MKKQTKNLNNNNNKTPSKLSNKQVQYQNPKRTKTSYKSKTTHGIG